MEPERDGDRDHDDGGDGEHHDVTQDRAQQQGEPAGGRDAEPLDHAGVHLPDDDPPGAHARAEGHQRQDAGHEQVEDLPGRQAGPAGQGLEQGFEERQVEQRGAQPGDDPDRLA
jgi:hypothetical protein